MLHTKKNLGLGLWVGAVTGGIGVACLRLTNWELPNEECPAERLDSSCCGYVYGNTQHNQLHVGLPIPP